MNAFLVKMEIRKSIIRHDFDEGSGLKVITSQPLKLILSSSSDGNKNTDDVTQLTDGVSRTTIQPTPVTAPKDLQQSHRSTVVGVIGNTDHNASVQAAVPSTPVVSHGDTALGNDQERVFAEQSRFENTRSAKKQSHDTDLSHQTAGVPTTSLPYTPLARQGTAQSAHTNIQGCVEPSQFKSTRSTLTKSNVSKLSEHFSQKSLQLTHTGPLQITARNSVRERVRPLQLKSARSTSKQSNITRMSERFSQIPHQPTPTGPRVYVASNKEQERFESFAIEYLPYELQELILIEIAVSKMRHSRTFRDAYRDLASVCTRWKDIVSHSLFFAKVKERFFKDDPLRHYLRSAEHIPIVGVGCDIPTTGIAKAVTAGNRLCLLEEEIKNFSIGKVGIFWHTLRIYDVDYVISAETNIRELRCSNRRGVPILILSKKHTVKYLLPCTQTNSIYIVTSAGEDLSFAIVCLVGLEVGGKYESCFFTSLFRLKDEIVNVSLSTLDRYLLVVHASGDIDVYDTTTRKLARTLKPTDKYVNGGAIPAAATILDNSSGSHLVTAHSSATAPGDRCNSFQDLVVADDHCVLVMSAKSFTVVDRVGARRVKMWIDPSLPTSHSYWHNWYDRARGLVFGTRNSAPIALRIKQ